MKEFWQLLFPQRFPCEFSSVSEDIRNSNLQFPGDALKSIKRHILFSHFQALERAT